MRVAEAKFYQDYLDMAAHGEKMGWHERNGGNFTYWLKPEDVEMVKDDLQVGRQWNSIGIMVRQLAGQYFLISGTGKYFYNINRDPEDCLGIIELDDKGENYRIVWGFSGGGRPTSEMPTHLMNMEVRARATGDKNRVIYHAHCTNLIAMTFLLPLKDEVFTRELWEMMTECPVVFPEGVGIVEWMVPGGREIAVATAQKAEKYNAVIWAHHGLFCSGEDFDSTFGLMHAIEKSAEIWIKVHSVSSQMRQTISVDGFRQLAREFNVQLNEQALYEKE
ncbi:rhamnulose-1-phosphate aldolase [Clostridiales bacterium COT073_COT-073]|nr:rhamnulose-1-phosphate aldolase [Clostridiales bacterium COT073_COT-073]